MTTKDQLPPLPTPKFTETIRGVPCITVTEHEHLMHAYALAALAQQAQEPWGWAIEDKHGVAQAIRPARKEFFGCTQATEPFAAEDVEKMGREWSGLVPHRIVKLYTTPQPQPAPPVPAPVGEREAWLPIESAPKDCAFLGYQRLTDELWLISPMYWSGSVFLIVQFHTDNTEHEVQPTHWQPLPPAPQATKGQP